MKRLKLLLSILKEELREVEEEEKRYKILEEIERIKVKIAMRELGWDKC